MEQISTTYKVFFLQDFLYLTEYFPDIYLMLKMSQKWNIHLNVENTLLKAQLYILTRICWKMAFDISCLSRLAFAAKQIEHLISSEVFVLKLSLPFAIQSLEIGEIFWEIFNMQNPPKWKTSYEKSWKSLVEHFY